MRKCTLQLPIRGFRGYTRPMTTPPNADPDFLRFHGSTKVFLPDGSVWRESRPQVTLILTPAEFRLEQRFAWLSWATFKLARLAEAGDPSGRRYIWSSPWSGIRAVQYKSGRLGVQTRDRGACYFRTHNPRARDAIRVFLHKNEIAFVEKYPDSALLRARR